MIWQTFQNQSLHFFLRTTPHFSCPPVIFKNYVYKTANIELEKAAVWFRANKLTLNVSKTKYILFRKSGVSVNLDNVLLKIGDKIIERRGEDCEDKYFKFVGILLDENLSWVHHLNHIRGKLSSANYAIAKVKNLLPKKIKLNIYNSLFRSHLEYSLLC